MSSTSNTFRLRYWGVTGTFANPLPPEVVEQKVRDSLHLLCQLPEFGQRLSELATDAVALAEFLQQHVPYACRSTYGGNTTCLEIESPQSLVIVDAGSGLRRLGDDLIRRWNAEGYQGDRSADVLLTHAHMDHTFATPFVEPYYDSRNCFRVWGPRKVLRSLNAVLSPSSSLRSIYFPLTYELLAGLDRFTTIKANQDFRVGDVQVRTHALNHPGDCLAYRLEAGLRRIVIATDHEHTSVPDEGLAEFARDVDLLYVDAQYLQDEYEGRTSIADEAPISRRGWGHSTVEAVIETAVAARVRRLRLGHHDPKRSDEGLAALEQHARRLLAATLHRHGLSADACEVSLAREGAEELL